MSRLASDVQRDIGRLEARADSQEERLERIEAKLDVLVEAWAQSRGGIRMLMVMGSLAATLAGMIGAAIAKFWPGGQS